MSARRVFRPAASMARGRPFLPGVAADRYPLHEFMLRAEVVAFRRRAASILRSPSARDIDLWLRVCLDAGACASTSQGFKASYRRDAGNRAMEHPCAERLLAFVERVRSAAPRIWQATPPEALFARLSLQTSSAARDQLVSPRRHRDGRHIDGASPDLSPKEHKRPSRKLHIA